MPPTINQSINQSNRHSERSEESLNLNTQNKDSSPTAQNDELVKNDEVKQNALQLRLLPDGTFAENFLIKGNNLIALHSLKRRYRGKVKLIYIDPPYNTGNDSFNYNDRFNHSVWLTFMKNRLEIAKELLRDDGVIFVQCDDNEQAYLKVLMDEIFGRENFVANMIWQKKTGTSDATHIATITEFTLCYARNINSLNLNRNSSSYDEKRYKYKDEFFETRGAYYIDNLDRGGLSYSDSLNYEIECPDGSITYPNGRLNYENDGWIWKWGKEKLKWGIENKFIEFRKSKTKPSGWAVCYKNYMCVDNENNPIQRAAPYKNLILDVMNIHATNEIQELFGSKTFATPKPENLLKLFIEIATTESDLVLDFFAGSGTTLAVAHKMNRRYIGIEQMDYIQSITIERLKKVIDGENGGISKAVNWQGGGSVIYAELMPLNAFFKEKIDKSTTLDELKAVLKDMQETAFLEYAVDREKLSVILSEAKRSEESLNLNRDSSPTAQNDGMGQNDGLAELKALLKTALDSNMDYVLYGDIDDAEYAIDDETKAFNKAFYGN